MNCAACGTPCEECTKDRVVGAYSRTPVQVRHRHEEMVELRKRGLYVKEIARVMKRRYGGPAHHSSIVHHLNEGCSCMVGRRDGA